MAVFGKDNFKPHALLSHESQKASNIVYACAMCNTHKAGYWPTDEGDATILHPLIADYSMHVRVDQHGVYHPKTASGNITIRYIALNRSELVEWRRELLALRRRRSELLKQALDELENFTAPEAAKSPGSRRSTPAEAREHLQELLEEVRKIDARNDVTFLAQRERAIDWIEAEKELNSYIMAYARHIPGALDKINPFVLEHLIGEYFASLGCRVRLVGRNPKTGADLMVIKTEVPSGTEIRYLVEVKRLKERVGIEEIDRVLGVLVRERQRMKWHEAIVCSATGFKRFRATNAGELKRLGVHLRGREDILHCLEEYKPRPDGGLWLPIGWNNKPLKSEIEEA
ncbi:restriction endonuclease [Sorangium sp. So ce429]